MLQPEACNVDFQLLRCILKILEVVYLKFHRLETGPGERSRSKSHCSSDTAPVVIDLTDEGDEPPESGPTEAPAQPPDGGGPTKEHRIEVLEDSDEEREKAASEEEEVYDKQLTDMLYEVLQNFMLDVVSALAEVRHRIASAITYPH